MFETIEFQAHGQVGVILLNRPATFHAFTEQMNKEITTALRQADKNPEIRCVVITGTGKAFCAGQDLGEVMEAGEEIDYGKILRERYNPMILQIQRTEKPVIAAVNGVAAGAGMSLALACDLRLASEQASFVNAFVNIGLVPDSGGCYFLPRIVGLGRALELAFTGAKIGAEEALQMGLVNKIYPTDSFFEEAIAYASKLAALPTRGIGLIKRTMYRSIEMSLEESLEYEAYSQEIAGDTRDHKEGVKAFLEKRKPQFRGI